jgi:excisionase family DNA binding protein
MSIETAASTKAFETATSLPDVWLTTAEAATYLKVKPRSLLLWVRQGKVKEYALSGTRRRVWRFRKQDLDDSVLSRVVVPSITPVAPAER